MKLNPKKVLFFIIVLVIGYFYFINHDNTIDIQVLFKDVHQSGWRGVLVFIFAYIFISGFLIPSIFFKVFAGTAFGIINGALIASTAAAISSLFKFLLARYFFQDKFSVKIEKNPRWRAIAHVVENDGWKMLILLRNVPLINGMFLNYICGVTKMNPAFFVLASFIGRLPQIFMLSYLGHLLGYTAGIGKGTEQHLVAEIVLFVVGGVASIAAGYYATQLYKKVLIQEKAILGS